jgi:sugar lactone lactonase YvrE
MLALGGCKSSTPPAPPAASVALWVGNGTGASVLGYTASQLASSTSAAPAVLLSTPTGNSNSGAAFDTGGNLWLAQNLANTVVEYTASQRTASGSPTPNVTLSATTAGSLNGPVALAFDVAGNLWVANADSSGLGANTLVEFTASQLAASGSPNPAVTLSDTAGSINIPQGLAFDHSGNLWMSNFFSVVEFSASQLAASGSPVPAVTLSSNGNGSLNEPESLAVDAGGNLWVPNFLGNNVVEFASSQLASSGSPTPAVTLTSSGPGVLANPVGLAFDGHGNLWVSSLVSNTVLEFTASQLMASGAPTPTVTISGFSIHEPTALAFTP